MRGGMPLTDTEANAYVAEQVRSAELVGLPASFVPADRSALAQYLVDVRPQLRMTPAARRGARGVLVPPMPTWVRLLTPARPAWGGLAAIGFGLLPGWARQMYRLPGFALADLAATGALRALRVGALAVPERFREGPNLKAAKARRSA